MLICIIEKSKIVIYLGLVIITWTNSGCKKFVQIDPPSTQIVTTSVFNDNNSATAALTAIYSQMQPESWNMSQCAGLLADELESPSSSSFIRPYYQNALLATTAPTPGPWKTAYSYIYQANAVIEGLQKGQGVSTLIKKQLTGEAEFIRAFWLFYLVNCYGDVPLPTTTDYTQNAALKRSPKEQVYQQIINDLKDAQGLLNTDYVDGSDTTISMERTRPNKAVATALLARVYLYMKDYPNAVTQATAILSNTKYKLVQDLGSVFLKNSDEAIWQLQVPSPAVYNTADGYNFILTSAPSTGSPNLTATISSILQNSFEINDQRKVAWIGSITTTGPDTTYYFPYKYKVNTFTSPILEYTMIFRLAEQYFIHAEALAQQNKNLNDAVTDINAIRIRAGLTEYAGPLEKDSILEAILHERQVELFVEWGHRWFDLIRTGNIDAIMSSVAPLKGGIWKPELALFPIPQSERVIDFNLTQNNGY